MHTDQDDTNGSPGFPKLLSSLTEAAKSYRYWLETAALPLWATRGVDRKSGGFVEGITLRGVPFDPFRRARVQARQTLVFAAAANSGFGDHWLPVAQRGFAFFMEHGKRSDGLVVSKLAADGMVIDETPRLYEQDFTMLAMAALCEANSSRRDVARAAAEIRDALDVMRHRPGGFREAGEHPFQANAHMHLLEASLSWEGLDGDRAWIALSDEVAELALTYFVDARSGVLREYFRSDWTPMSGELGLVEPGHHFEWAWLLERWGRLRGEPRAKRAARRLFDQGLRGVDARRQVVVNSLWDDLSVRDGAARLWPQTEYLKAALILGEDVHALAACRGLAQYLEVPIKGAWRDKMSTDGSFVDEPAPASSFYHIVVALFELFTASGQVA
jgi:mannose-1-phosphate guanylyltransferase/mannose-6-phosphate isomerase